MTYNHSLLPELVEGKSTVRVTKTTMKDRVLRNLRQQMGVYCLKPRERFYFIENYYTGYSAYFTGNEIRLTEDNFDKSFEINSHRYLYLLADNHESWCLYKFQYHTYTDYTSGAMIKKGLLELVPYDSSDGRFFAVHYLDL